MRSKDARPIASLVAVAAACLLLHPPALASEESPPGSEHWVESRSALDGKPLKLYLWEKRPRGSDPTAFATSGKVALLAHGAGTPGRVAFDLQVAGAPGPGYSLMDYLVDRGFDVFALDYQNYGRSEGHACGLCVTTQVAADDVNAAVDHIRKLRGVDKLYLLGWSWGTNVTGLFAMQHPEKVNRLVLYAPPVWTQARGKPPTEQFRQVTPADSRRLFEPSASDDAAVEAWVREVAHWGPRTPNGVRVDLTSRMPLTDPAKIAPPTMIILGSLDRLTPVSQKELPAFFASLPNADKQFIVVPGGGHALVVQKPRLRLYAEVAKWFSYE